MFIYFFCHPFRLGMCIIGYVCVSSVVLFHTQYDMTTFRIRFGFSVFALFSLFFLSFHRSLEVYCIGNGIRTNLIHQKPKEKHTQQQSMAAGE